VLGIVWGKSGQPRAQLDGGVQGRGAVGLLDMKIKLPIAISMQYYK